MAAPIDLRGCEYLGGCPTIGSKVLNKVELHFTDDGLSVAIAPQGLFTMAAARTVLELAWTDMTAISVGETNHGKRTPGLQRVLRRIYHAFIFQLDLPYEVIVRTDEWTMTVGIRIRPDLLASELQQLLSSCALPTPVISVA